MNTADKIQACVTEYETISAKIAEYVDNNLPSNATRNKDTITFKIVDQTVTVRQVMKLTEQVIDNNEDLYNVGTIEFMIHLTDNRFNQDNAKFVSALLTEAANYINEINTHVGPLPIRNFVSSKEDRLAAEQKEQLKAVDRLLQSVIIEDGKWLRTGKSKQIVRLKHNLPLGNHTVTADDKKVYTLNVNSQDYFEIARIV